MRTHILLEFKNYYRIIGGDKQVLIDQGERKVQRLFSVSMAFILNCSVIRYINMSWSPIPMNLTLLGNRVFEKCTSVIVRKEMTDTKAM